MQDKIKHKNSSKPIKEVLEDFTSKIKEKYTNVDFIINNAGLTKGGLLTCTYEDFLYVQKTSLAAPFMLAKLLIEDHLEKKQVIIR